MDHATGLIFIHNQACLCIGKTLSIKSRFGWFAKYYDIKIHIKPMTITWTFKGVSVEVWVDEAYSDPVDITKISSGVQK